MNQTSSVREGPQSVSGVLTENSRIPMAYISTEVPQIEQMRDLDRLKKLCPQLVTAKTLLAGHFNTIEVADQVNAMIESFLAVGIRPLDQVSHM